MALTRILSRLVYPPRQPDVHHPPSAGELDAWVGAAETPYFQQLDDAFVGRALGLGVTSGMVLDLDSPLGLVALKILWKEEGFLSIGVYRSLDMAERARQTAEVWDLGDRMFFQVGEPSGLRFKTGYFDLVVSDGALHYAQHPEELLAEIGRVTKPSGAILLGQRARPGRLRMAGVLSGGGRFCQGALGRRFEATVRAGYTRSELAECVAAAGLDRARVVADGERLFIERRGADDPSSWVVEREKYL